MAEFDPNSSSLPGGGSLDENTIQEGNTQPIIVTTPVGQSPFHDSITHQQHQHPSPYASLQPSDATIGLGVLTSANNSPALSASSPHPYTPSNTAGFGDHTANETRGTSSSSSSSSTATGASSLEPQTSFHPSQHNSPSLSAAYASNQGEEPQHYSQLVASQSEHPITFQQEQQSQQPPFRRSIASGQFIVNRAQHQPQFQAQSQPQISTFVHQNPTDQLTPRFGSAFSRASTGQIHTGLPYPYPGASIPPASSNSSWLQSDPTRLYQSVPAPSSQFGHYHHSPFHPPTPSSFMSANDQAAHMLQRGASAGTTSGYQCPNCGKTFARDDLLRRHLAREARAAAQPSLDRQKSCYECARSKARCDLEVPSCGRCRTRGKTCVYGARSGNPNVRKTVRSTSQEYASGIAGAGPSQWAGPLPADGSQWPSAGITVPSNAPHYPFPKNEGSEDYESDDSRNWSDSYQQFRGDRTLSSSSSNTNDSFDYGNNNADQQAGYAMNYADQTPYLIGPSTSMGGRLAAGGIDTSVPRIRAEDDEQTPISQAMNAVMGPPQITPMRGQTSNNNWPGAIPNAPNSRPEVPRLLTGARMPRPAEAGQASARPLFSAQLDLSGWLEEPVIPSPLYRMGPSLSALGSNAQSFTLPTPTLASQAGNQLLSTALLPAPSNASQSQSADTVMGANNTNTSSSKPSSASEHAQVAARNWWAAGPSERTSIDSQEVAQACAGHFTLYPALMVLPDATSPVPPLFHRPWLANTRLQTPASLAQVRVALAAYHVRLPASEGMVWEMIKAQAKAIVASYDALVQSSDMEVFSSTAALWFLVILLLMSTDPATGQCVDEGLTDSCLVGLSHLSYLLQKRVQALEQVHIEQRQANGAASPSFIDWGFLETMRRTLFACYALFVLQRFRATSPELQSRLAGVELVMDIKLPATASEFEAGNELEWRAAQHVKITDDQGIALGGALTMRELLTARSAAQQQQWQRQASKADQNKEKNDSSENSSSSTTVNSDEETKSPITEERRKQMLAYFDRHDDFTNVCLTVTFALDARILP
ncbi:uncharacterized protein FA14DRAFT_161183 [Meira miltonrushii]|uniref:Zn(2)-C6 fungal-type domain-containing protein n=1 Tax=Meira miltonrushii TaxID=1280837 RepID=A0A316VAK0_9BASI|nr:uncharacterized protein FA14DRAFT_161183 [Meira miltonrushii]PWN33223.1 hypothetical protein FA14DRAFT_161183 [Meira miltonrushii]